MGKTGISGETFWGKDHQDSGKNWDLWRFFFGGGGRTTKIVGKTGISGDFFGGKDPQIVGKTGISGDFFFLRRNPKIVGKTGISGDFFCGGGKEPQDSGKNWDLLRIFFVFEEGTPK